MDDLEIDELKRLISTTDTEWERIDTLKPAMKASIKHWKRLIAWVKLQPETARPSDDAMIEAIDTHWTSDPGVCQYFNTFSDNRYYTEDYACQLCSLQCRELMHAINAARTWRRWLLAANKLLNKLHRQSRLSMATLTDDMARRLRSANSSASWDYDRREERVREEAEDEAMDEESREY